ncbi:hypothetical protein [Methylorubrum zatmanii]
MGIYADLGRTLAASAEAATAVRVLVSDPESGAELYGVVTGEHSETHVLIRADDGLVFPAAKASLTFLPGDAP